MVHDIVIFSGSSHPELSNNICGKLSLEKGGIKLGKFSNGETSISVNESVREKDVYVVQSGCGHVNDNFLELLIILSACKTASAKRVTAVIPLFPYSRQPDIPYTKKGAPKSTFESVPSTPMVHSLSSSSSASLLPPPPSFKLNGPSPAKDNQAPPPTSSSSSRIPKIPDSQQKSEESGITDSPANPNTSNAGYKKWVAQSGTLIANLLTTAGADHIITMDLHDAQFQGFFDIPVDNLYSKPILQHYITSNFHHYHDMVIVSPDAGGAKRATAVADALQMPFALIHKERRLYPNTDGNHTTVNNNNSAMDSPDKKMKYATTMLVGDVKGKECVLIDDLVDTSYTITRAAKLLKQQGATKVYALITHAIFSGDALKRVKESAVDKIIVTNSVPQEEHVKALGEKIEVLDVSKIFGEAIRRIHNGESVSMLFDHGW